jgi:hypothetical protein
MFSGFAAMKAIGKLFVESSEFIHEIFNISFAKVKLWNGVKVFVVSYIW